MEPTRKHQKLTVVPPTPETPEQQAAREEKARIARKREPAMPPKGVTPVVNRKTLDPEHLIDPEDPESRRQGPLELKWYRDPAWRRWEEAKRIAARWNISQKHVNTVEHWMAKYAITAYREFPAVWETEQKARKSLEIYMTKNPA